MYVNQGEFYQGIRRPIPSPLASKVLIETCMACLYSNQITVEIATMPKFRNRIIVILATGLYQ